MRAPTYTARATRAPDVAKELEGHVRPRGKRTTLFHVQLAEYPHSKHAYMGTLASIYNKEPHITRTSHVRALLSTFIACPRVLR